MKLQADTHLKDSWNADLVGQLHANIVSDFLKCDTEQSIKASVEFVKFLKHKGLDCDNYPFYMSLFLHPNESIIQAFLGDGKILNSLSKLQRSHNLLKACFELLYLFTPKVAYENTLVSLMTVIYINYRNPVSGYYVFPLNNDNLNSLGKYLDKNKPQTSKLNRLILDILADIGDLKSKEEVDQICLEIAARANRIRNVFFDNRASMSDIIPRNLLAL